MATSSQRSIALPELSEKRLQPFDMTFPRRPFGKTKVVRRSFQSVWYKQWKWLHYDVSNDLTSCFICVKAIQSGMQMCFCRYFIKCVVFLDIFYLYFSFFYFLEYYLLVFTYLFINC